MLKGIRGSLLVALVAAGTLVAAAAPAAMAQNRVVKVDGSSTVFPITQAVAEDFQKANKGVKVTVGIVGSGGGMAKLLKGEIDIADSSRPITQGEVDEAKAKGVEFIELPVAFDALTVVINKQNTWAEQMTVEELKKLWEPEAEKKITKWSDIRPGWPDNKIQLYGPGTNDGTFFYFTEAIVGKPKSSRSDFTASEDDNTLVRGVAGSKYAIGYFGYAYYIAHKDQLKAVSVQWDKNLVTKEPVAPSQQAVENGSYAPLSRPLFIYVNKQAAQNRPEVKAFVDYYLTHAGKLAAEVKYVALPAKAYELLESRFAKLQTGSAFLGKDTVGMHIEDVLAEEQK